jgi:hypothetical protein
VNGVSWRTEAKDIKEVRRIVFDEDLSSIPAFGCPGLENKDETRIRISEVVIPSSVRRIASQAFPDDMFDIMTMRLNCLENLYLEQGSLEGVRNLVYDIPLFKDSNTLDFSDEVIFEIGAGGEVTFGFDGLTPYIHQYGLNGYALKREKNIMVLYLFANDFLIGFARNAYVTTYYAHEGDMHPYHVRISIEGVFDSIMTSCHRPTETFLGWYENGDEREDGDLLTHKNTIVYGLWETSG